MIFSQTKLQNLYDNYIKGFPKNNLSEPQWKEGFVENKIVTHYDIDGAKIRIEITYNSLINRYEIRRFYGEMNDVSVQVMPAKGSELGEVTAQSIYKSLTVTRVQIEEAIEVAEEKKEEVIKEEEKKEKEEAKEEKQEAKEEKEKEKAKDENSEEMDFLESQKEQKKGGGSLKKK